MERFYKRMARKLHRANKRLNKALDGLRHFKA